MFFWQLHTGKTMTSVSWHQHESRVWDSYFKIRGNSCLKRLFILVLHTVARTPLVGLTTCATFFSFNFNICSIFFCLCFSGFLLSSLYDAFSRSPSSVTSTPMLHCWIFYKSSNFTFISSSCENILRQVFWNLSLHFSFTVIILLILFLVAISISSVYFVCVFPLYLMHILANIPCLYPFKFTCFQPEAARGAERGNDNIR